MTALGRSSLSKSLHTNATAMRLTLARGAVLTAGLHAATTGAHEPPPLPVEAVLLLTEGRSGSTFVGELLNQDKR